MTCDRSSRRAGCFCGAATRRREERIFPSRRKEEVQQADFICSTNLSAAHQTLCFSASRVGCHAAEPPPPHPACDSYQRHAAENKWTSRHKITSAICGPTRVPRDDERLCSFHNVRWHASILFFFIIPLKPRAHAFVQHHRSYCGFCFHFIPCLVATHFFSD